MRNSKSEAIASIVTTYYAEMVARYNITTKQFLEHIKKSKNVFDVSLRPIQFFLTSKGEVYQVYYSKELDQWLAKS